MQKREIVKTRIQGANTSHLCKHIENARSKPMPRLARFTHVGQVVFVACKG